MELILPNPSHKEQYLFMMEEWIKYGGRIHPAALINNGVSYEKWLQWMEDDRYYKSCPKGSPPQTLYFCIEKEEIIGAVTIRDYLNQKTLIDGGYIGFGIRPSKRRMGKATEALLLAVQKVYEKNIFEILLTCAEDNIGSEKTMLKLGAIYENTINCIDGERVKRFWLCHTKLE